MISSDSSRNTEPSIIVYEILGLTTLIDLMLEQRQDILTCQTNVGFPKLYLPSKPLI